MSSRVSDLVAAIRRDVEAATLLLNGVLARVGALVAETGDQRGDGLGVAMPPAKATQAAVLRPSPSFEQRVFDTTPPAKAAAIISGETPIAERPSMPEALLAQDVWPAGCHRPGSCERNRRCSYFPCPHMEANIEAAIDAAVAKPRSAPFTMIGKGGAARRAVEPADKAQIERFIAERGVTKLPAAAVEATSANIPPEDRAAIAAHDEKRREAEIEEAKRRWHRK